MRRLSVLLSPCESVMSVTCKVKNYPENDLLFFVELWGPVIIPIQCKQKCWPFWVSKTLQTPWCMTSERKSWKQGAKSHANGDSYHVLHCSRKSAYVVVFSKRTSGRTLYNLWNIVNRQTNWVFAEEVHNLRTGLQHHIQEMSANFSKKLLVIQCKCAWLKNRR